MRAGARDDASMSKGDELYPPPLAGGDLHFVTLCQRPEKPPFQVDGFMAESNLVSRSLST